MLPIDRFPGPNPGPKPDASERLEADTVIGKTLNGNNGDTDPEIIKVQLQAVPVEPSLTDRAKQIISEMAIEANWQNQKSKFIPIARQIIQTKGAWGLRTALTNLNHEESFKFILKQLNDEKVLVPDLEYFLWNELTKKSKNPLAMTEAIMDYAILIEAQYANGILNADTETKRNLRENFLYCLRDLLHETAQNHANFHVLCTVLPKTINEEIFPRTSNTTFESNLLTDIFSTLKAEGLYDPMAPRSINIK